MVNTCATARAVHFWFGSVFIKKSNQTDFFLKKSKPNQNQFKPTGFDSVQFSFLEQKPVQTGLARFFPFGSVFSVFLVFSGFFRFGLVFSVPGLKNRN